MTSPTRIAAAETRFIDDLVVSTAEEIRRRLLEARRAGGRLGDQDRAAIVEEVLAASLSAARVQLTQTRARPLPLAVEDDIRARIREITSPLGVMGPALRPDLWTDVQVNGAENMICIQVGTGRRIEYASPFASDAEAFAWAAEQAAAAGRRFDEAVPSARFRLPNGARVHVISRVTDATHISCRLPTPSLDTIAALAATGMFGPDVAAVLAGAAALDRPVGLVISGGTGCGKTTLLRAWAHATPADPELRRVVTVEDEQELLLSPDRFRDLVAFEAREANVEGKGAYPMARYLADDLRRQHPHRVLLGELKPDGGVMPLLLALGQGVASGVATTLHAYSAEEVIDRIILYASLAEHGLSEQVVLRTIGATVNLIVHLELVHQRRVITEVREVTGYRDGRVISAPLWRWDPQHGRAVRTDMAMSQELTGALVRAGVDVGHLMRAPSGPLAAMGAWPQ